MSNDLPCCFRSFDAETGERSRSDRSLPLFSHRSGAFSNVYKAIDRETGQKVAVKVVRKYELNSNQVSVSILFPSN